MDNIKELLDYVKINNGNDFLYKQIFDLMLLKLRKLEKQNHYISVLIKRNDYKILNLDSNEISEDSIKTIKYLDTEYLVDDFDVFYPPIDSEIVLDITDNYLYKNITYTSNNIPSLSFMYGVNFIDYSKLNTTIGFDIYINEIHRDTLEGFNLCNIISNKIKITYQPKLNKMIFNKLIAPEGIFIDTTSSNIVSVPGYEATEPKKIIVPTGATGYDQNGWTTLLDNGWTIEYSDELAAELNGETTT